MKHSPSFTDAAIPGPQTAAATNKARWRWIAFAAWSAVALMTAVVYLQPVRSPSVHLELLAGSLALWLGALLLVRHKAVRIASVVLPLLLAGLLSLPGHRADARRLRARYVRALLSYEGTPYVWGGETRRGIDCSGLIRGGLIRAQWQEGFATRNPALWREAIALAWNDTSARAMRDEYGGQTRLLFRVKGITNIKSNQLLPGDFAVTANGIHTLAYVGNDTWIEAEPGEKVITLKVGEDNPWLKMHVCVLRWRRLETKIL